ncbi:membrane hypothetical protein [Rhodospirillaceae bacterium LM-1]|nr:membrane hypothetical protein [Rhodospirillaceae bacterium LM-1]
MAESELFAALSAASSAPSPSMALAEEEEVADSPPPPAAQPPENLTFDEIYGDAGRPETSSFFRLLPDLIFSILALVSGAAWLSRASASNLPILLDYPLLLGAVQGAGVLLPFFVLSLSLRPLWQVAGLASALALATFNLFSFIHLWSTTINIVPYWLSGLRLSFNSPDFLTILGQTLNIAPEYIGNYASWALANNFASAATILVSVVIFAELLNDWQDKTANRDHLGRKIAENTPHHVSRFMPLKNIEKFFSKGNLILGQLGKGARSTLVLYNLEAHVIALAPSRVGKGTAFAIPNILTNHWVGSRLIMDTKGEAAMVCRKNGRQIRLLDPFGMVKSRLGDEAPPALRYNPLDLVRPGEEMRRDAQAIASAICPIPGKANATAQHFASAANDLISGTICWVCSIYPPESRNLIKVYELLTLGDDVSEEDDDDRPRDPLNPRSFDDLMISMQANPQIGYRAPFDAAARVARAGANERGGILSTVKNSIGFLGLPEIQRCLSASDFPLDKAILAGGRDIFLVVPPDLLEALSGWLRVMLIIPRITVVREKPKHRAMVLIDEAAQLGYLSNLQNDFAQMAGFNLSYCVITQNNAAMRNIYGEMWESITTNAEVILYLGTARTDNTSAKEISALLGTVPLVDEGHESKSCKDMSGPGDTTTSKSKSVAVVPLVSPAEILEMPKGELFILAGISGGRRDPVRCRFANYFARPDLNKLACPNPYRQ